MSVRATDPDDVAVLTNWYSVNEGAWNAVVMTPQGNGLYTAVIPGQSAAVVIHFYVAGVDMLGATSMYPPAGPEERLPFSSTLVLGPSHSAT